MADNPASDGWSELYEARFQSVYWTLEQLIAWIACKNRRAVGSLAAESLAEISHDDAWEKLHEWDLLIAHSLKHEASMPDTSIHSELSAARYAVIQALQTGRIVATWKLRGKERTSISRLHWADHDIRRNAYGLLDTQGGDRNGNNQVRVELEKILELWPEALSHPSSLISDESTARDLLTELMEKSPDKPTMSKEEALKWVLTQVPSLGKRASHRAWSSAIEKANAQAWSGAGRRPRANRIGTPT